MINDLFSHRLHRCTQRLPASDTTISFLHDSSVAPSTEGESVVHVSFRADTRAARWNTAPGRDPDSSGAVVDLVSAGSHRSVTVGNSADYSDLFTTIAVRIGIYSCDVCL